MALGRDIERFIQDFWKELEENNAAIFAGAGLSVGSGYVDWKGLLKPIAEELGLDVDRERDFISLTQYHVNESGGNRGKLNRILIEQFSKQAQMSENHRLLARLPISVFWTTNYDTLIEQALEHEGKRPDVKHEVKQLQLTRLGRDAVVYKMHGDVAHPADAVLTRDDYERYHQDRQLFLTALSGDLVSMTFLFLGLSFTDPNIDYILSRVRVWLGKNVREHYAILRRVQRGDFANKGDYDYAARQQELFVNDLKRFGITAVLVDDYAEITAILSRLYELHRGRSILLSGAAHEYGHWSRQSAEGLIQRLSRELVEKGYRIVSGFGLGIGSAAIGGALEAIYSDSSLTVSDRAILRPFPQAADGRKTRPQVQTRYREDLVSLAGTAIFVFGNRLDEKGHVINSPGVQEEFDLAVNRGLKVIPIGATGYAARCLWERVRNDFDRYFPDAQGVKRPFLRLGKDNADEGVIVSAVLDILDRLRA